MRVAFVFFGALAAAASLAVAFPDSSPVALWVAYGSIAAAFVLDTVAKKLSSPCVRVFRGDATDGVSFNGFVVASIVLIHIYNAPLGTSLALALLCLGM